MYKLPYKSFITVYAPIMESGWGIYKCLVDCRFSIYVCMTHNFIDGQKSYDFGLLCDLLCEVPCYCFCTLEQAMKFCKTKSNRYPIDRQLYWLRFRPDYWFSTVINGYFTVEQWKNGEIRI